MSNTEFSLERQSAFCRYHPNLEIARMRSKGTKGEQGIRLERKEGNLVVISRTYNMKTNFKLICRK